jgi:hypothetical protein
MGMVFHTYNPSTGEAETEESGVSGQPGLKSQTLFQKQIKNHEQGGDIT